MANEGPAQQHFFFVVVVAVTYLEVNQLGRLCFKRLFLLSPSLSFLRLAKAPGAAGKMHPAWRTGFVPVIEQRPLPIIGEALWQLLDCIPSHFPLQKRGYSLLFHTIHYQPFQGQGEISCLGGELKNSGKGPGLEAACE